MRTGAARATLAALLPLAVLAIPAGGEAVLRAWFAAVVTWAAVPIGCLLLLILNHLLGREVFFARIAEAGARCLPVLALAFLPVLLLPEAIYPWARPGFSPSGPLQAVWLQPTAFALRGILWFAVLIALARFLMRQDRQVGPAGKMRGRAAVAALVYIIVLSLAGLDWVMTLDPGFASSGFALVLAAHQVTMALAFAVLLEAWLPHLREPRQAARGFLLAGVLAWALFAYLEYLTVWSGNVPSLSRWFVDRATGGWPPLRWLAAGLTLLGVVLLLLVPLGRTRLLLRLGALAVGVGQMAEIGWQVLPALGPADVGTAALHAAALLAVAAILALAFRRALLAPPEPEPP